MTHHQAAWEVWPQACALRKEQAQGLHRGWPEADLPYPQGLWKRNFLVFYFF